MLKKFGFINSYSYREWTELDLSAELSDDLDDYGLPLPVNPELHDVVRKRTLGNKYGVLPVAAIYGKNAGGKTKLLNTLRDVALDALDASFSAATVHSDMSPFEQIIKQRQFCILSRAKRKNAIRYFICVVLKNTEYTLDYTIRNEGVTKEKVTTKNLLENNKNELLYSRNGSDYDEGTSDFINKYLELMHEGSDNQLLFPVIAQRYAGLKEFYEWFKYVRDGINLNDNNHQDEKLEDIAKRIANNNDEPFRQRLLHFLTCLDNSVVDIQGVEKWDKYRLWVYHRRTDNTDKKYAPFIEKESAGTRKLIEQFPLIDRCLKNGMPFICDEFDKMLHPVAFKQLVRMFNDPDINTNDAQLIFTAHDTFALDSSFLRRDEVHIVDKNEESVSSVKRLSEMSHVETYSNMEREFRTNYYGSTPAEFHNSYDMVHEHEPNS